MPLAVILFRLLTSLAQAGFSTPILRRAISIPAPLSVPPTTYWEGIDGTWNTFALQVGTPAQTSRVLISTALQESFVINPKACQFTTTNEQCNDLADNRGGVYNSNSSTTYENQGIYELRVEQNLDYAGTGLFGYESVALGYTGEAMPLLKHQIIGQVAVEDFWYGYFGLHPKSTNFTDLLQNVPSYMTSLYQQRLIPSVSWGYTAGAIYRFARRYGSLTLGGYDENRFIPNDVTFRMGEDNDRELLVYINSITIEGTTKSLLSSPHYSYIDSTVPEIWLPTETCKLFEKEFGLTWDNATNLYFVTDTQHDALIARNANITFSLSTAAGVKKDVQIMLPYAAFDAVARPPYRRLLSPQRYFPLRNAMNDTQYTLGRTFLQEAYLTVDWERQNFKVYQCAWLPNSQKALVPILSTNTTMYPSLKKGKTTVGSGMIAGVAAGVIISILILIVLTLYLQRKQKQRQEAEALYLKREAEEDSRASLDHSSTLVVPKHELDATDQATIQILEKDSNFLKIAPFVEAPESIIYELPGDNPQKSEVDGRELSEKEAIRVREHRYNGFEEPVSESSPISPVAPGSGTHTAGISSSAEGATLVSARSPISPLIGRKSSDAKDQQAPPQQPMPSQKTDATVIRIVTNSDNEAETQQEARPTPGELLEGGSGWSHFADRVQDAQDTRKRFSFEK